MHVRWQMPPVRDHRLLCRTLLLVPLACALLGGGDARAQGTAVDDTVSVRAAGRRAEAAGVQAVVPARVEVTAPGPDHWWGPLELARSLLSSDDAPAIGRSPPQPRPTRDLPRRALVHDPGVTASRWQLR
jgi:hypothetical protein